MKYTLEDRYIAVAGFTERNVWT